MFQQQFDGTPDPQRQHHGTGEQPERPALPDHQHKDNYQKRSGDEKPQVVHDKKACQGDREKNTGTQGGLHIELGCSRGKKEMDEARYDHDNGGDIRQGRRPQPAEMYRFGVPGNYPKKQQEAKNGNQDSR